MQIDNQFELDTAFPVTLFSSTTSIEKEGEKAQPFFNLNLVVSKDIPEVLYFKKIEFFDALNDPLNDPLNSPLNNPLNTLNKKTKGFNFFLPSVCQFVHSLTNF